MENVRSLLVDLDAEPSIVPLTRARRPSFGSPTAPALRAIAEGGVPVPTAAMPPLGGRSSTWPYGSARTPRTSSSVPRAGGATPSGSLTGIPPVASAMARSGGVPSLPASATTTPRTNTVVPIGLSRAAAMVIGGDALGEADGAAEGEGEGVAEGDGERLGAAVGVGPMVGDEAAGVGLEWRSAWATGWQPGRGRRRRRGWRGSEQASASGSLGLAAAVGRATASARVAEAPVMDSPPTARRRNRSGRQALGHRRRIDDVVGRAVVRVDGIAERTPGRRSIELPAAGAGAAIPSTKAFVASPQTTASTGWPPMGRTTIAPPVAAKPPEYVTSAEAAKIPDAFATSRWRPGSRASGVDHEAFRVTVLPLLVTYATSRPARSTAVADAFVSSTYSSDPDTPPVTTSATRSAPLSPRSSRAYFRNKYVELTNASATAVDLAGLEVASSPAAAAPW